VRGEDESVVFHSKVLGVLDRTEVRLTEKTDDGKRIVFLLCFLFALFALFVCGLFVTCFWNHKKRSSRELHARLHLRGDNPGWKTDVSCPNLMVQVGKGQGNCPIQREIFFNIKKDHSPPSPFIQAKQRATSKKE